MTPRLVTSVTDLLYQTGIPKYYVDYIGSHSARCKRYFLHMSSAVFFITRFPESIKDNEFEKEPPLKTQTQLNPLGANDFFTIANSIAEVLTKKNELYGDSALNPIEVFQGKTKVGQRADDKVSRIKNSPTLRKNDVGDLIGYLVLMCKENNWTDFSDQID